MTARSKKGRNFEEDLERLETIVGEIESDKLGLDRQFELFKEGMALARFCEAKLTDVQRSVEIVLKDSDSEWKTAEFEGGDASGEGPSGPSDPLSGEDAEDDDRT